MNQDIWAVWPTVRPKISNKVAQRWKQKGYQVGILLNPPHQPDDIPEADLVVVQEEWLGFPIAANILCWEIPGDIVVVVGDDVYPDPKFTAAEIGEDFQKRFPDLLGVMQPTGDKYGSWDRCAVSPWIGRQFINSAYEGIGPYWPGYFHYFCDEELQAYALQLGCFQQRADVTQYHDHWQRHAGKKRPQYLRDAKCKWAEDRDQFLTRQAKGFPHEFNDIP